ncbi:HAMP domain-containing sensor histidine kinase [Comamonas antarctica]|uniref:sensor histidine kinase n=1 Tax=Comamonas antarctica TaxID=2743470 RepID=UPI0028EBA6CF|nr:HAMP domain-containing sensor histidine kinase [Comamonas antarctica]
MPPPDGHPPAGRQRWRQRCCRWLRPWSDSLWSRLAWVLGLGMLITQGVTSSVWFDLRYRHAMEMPIRLVSVQLADTLRTLELASALPAAQQLASLESGQFQLTLRHGPMPSGEDPDDLIRSVEDILNQSLSDRLGVQRHAQVLAAELIDDHGRTATLWRLLAAREPVGHFRIAVPLPAQPGQWLEVVASEAQGGIEAEPVSMIIDYVLRIYVLRILLVIAVALLAVRWVLQPMRRLAAAADALGRDLHRAPLPEDGPREVRQAAQTFNLMQRRLLEDRRERTRFLAAVSHDLRTPITRLRLRTELLPSGPLQARFRQDLEAMEQMVSSTLDFMRGEEHAEARQKVDVNGLLAGLRADFEEAGAKLALQGQARLPLSAYAASLRRCLQNLLENAIRYGGAAEIHVADSARELRIAIVDDGPGIPEESMELVFEPFYCVESSRNAELKGSGLGLSIARSIAQAHGATLELRNRSPRGLEAVLTIPRI